MTEHIDAMKSAQVAIEAALEMHGPDHAGLLLGALAKVDKALGAFVTPAQGATDTEYERELFAAITKIDLATAVSHIRNWTCYIDDYHRQKYADLIEAQAKLIAHLVNTRAPSLPEGMRCGEIDLSSPTANAIMGAARLHTHDHEMACRITREVLQALAFPSTERP